MALEKGKVELNCERSELLICQVHQFLQVYFSFFSGV